MSQQPSQSSEPPQVHHHVENPTLPSFSSGHVPQPEYNPVTLSTFYLVEHKFVADDTANAMEKYWKEHGALTEADWANRSKDYENQGFHSHSYMPISKAGPIFCVWEASPVKTEEEFKHFIDSSVFPGLFTNTVYKIDNDLVGLHGHSILCRPESRRFTALPTALTKVADKMEAFAGNVGAVVGDVMGKVSDSMTN